MKMRQETKKGFTLFEIILAIGIFMIIAGFAIPISVYFYDTQIARSTVDEIFSALKKSQAFAFYRRDDNAHGVKFTEDSFIIFRGVEYDPDANTNEVFPIYGINAEFDPENADSVVVFDKSTGYPTDWNGLITLSRGSVSLDISICDTGLIEMGSDCGFIEEDEE